MPDETIILAGWHAWLYTVGCFIAGAGLLWCLLDARAWWQRRHPAPETFVPDSLGTYGPDGWIDGEETVTPLHKGIRMR